MTERSLTNIRSTSGGLHFQLTKMLVVALTVAVAATGALIITILIGVPQVGPPPGPPPGGMPPPPPNLQPLAVISVVTGFFVLSWLAVLVIFSRDQILLHLRQQQETGGVSPDALSRELSELRASLAADHEQEMRKLSESLAEYGERRETDGYLHGMRTATANDQPEANVRSLRRDR
jgi:hypothetical protein